MAIFDAATHTYIIPNVSTIITTVFPNMYTSIPQQVLDAAAKWGKQIHRAIETRDDSDLNDIQKTQFQKYRQLCDEHCIVPLVHEQMVTYDALYAGTYDMLADILGANVLIDVKTTAKLEIGYLEYQLSMYAMAAEKAGTHIDALGVLWLPKRGKGKFVLITRLEDEVILKTVERYYRRIEENGR